MPVGVLVWLIGFRIAKSSAALSPAPSVAKAQTDPSTQRADTPPLPPRVAQLRPLCQDRVREPPEPDALPLPFGAHEVHSVVPVPGPHQRETVAPDRQAAVERAGAVLEQRAPLSGHAWLEIRLGLPGGEERPPEERNDLVEEARVFGDLEIPEDHVRKPEQIGRSEE